MKNTDAFGASVFFCGEGICVKMRVLWVDEG